jgi:hypothetical protein
MSQETAHIDSFGSEGLHNAQSAIMFSIAPLTSPRRTFLAVALSVDLRPLLFEHSHRFALRPASVAGAFICGRRTELRGRRSGSIETVSRILTRWGEIGAGLHADSWIWS